MNMINYRLVLKAQPGIQGGGDKKYYASLLQRERITSKELSNEIADGCALTPTDMMAVLISLSKKIPSHLLHGNILDLGELGTLTVNISNTESATEEEFEASMIKEVKIQFRPSVDMRNSLKTASFRKRNGS